MLAELLEPAVEVADVRRGSDDALAVQLQDEARAVVTSTSHPLEVTGLTDWTIGELPRQVQVGTGGLEPGQRVALLGLNGSGKTSVLNLLLRFYDPTEGAVRIDGVDLRDVQTASLRRLVGVVTQETILFNDTIANNIAYGPLASRAERHGSIRPRRMSSHRHTMVSGAASSRSSARSANASS